MRICYLVGFPFLFLFVECDKMNLTNTKQCPNVKTSSFSVKKRRYLTFPENSDVVLTISLVKAFMTHAPSGWNIALEIDILFPLPDSKITNAYFRRKIHHKQKREIWERVQSTIDFHNMNGHSCIIRSICEANQILAPVGVSLIHDILRSIFKVPVNDAEFNNEMRGFYDELTHSDFCDITNDCPFSLLDFVLSLNQRV